MVRLSEVIDNQPEYPGPQQEWDMCKQLVDTLIESGALHLLRNLYNLIANDARLGYRLRKGREGVYLNRELEVKDVLGIKEMVQTEAKVAGANLHPATKFHVKRYEAVLRNEDIHTEASITLLYNEFTIIERGTPMSIFPHVGRSDYFYTGYTELSAMVSDYNPERVVLSIRDDISRRGRSNILVYSNHGSLYESVENARSPKGKEMVDKYLGDFYSAALAISPDFRYKPD